MFKKKQVKSKNLRKIDLDDDLGPLNIPVKKERHSGFVRNEDEEKEQPKSFTKWITKDQETSNEGSKRSGSGLDNIQEGTILIDLDEEGNEEDMTSKPEPKYVPTLDDSISTKLANKSMMKQMANEYGSEDDYDKIEDNNNATIDPNPDFDLQIDHDDEMAEDEELNLSRQTQPKPFANEEIYDREISEDSEGSDTEFGPITVKVTPPIPPSQEILRLQSLMDDLTLEKDISEKQISQYNNQMTIISQKKTNLLQNLEELAING